ncbi:MAG TPA: rhomboid family intramembrane serine protease [Thermoanaerobaculia bacterium]|nr:rhomboid family intramembrane serine protease [Thermoanaerobaculia bacterium]
MLPLRDDVPSRRRPVVTIALILVNVAFFVYELSLGPRLQEFLMSAAFVPARLFGGGPDGGGEVQAGGALLSMFLHGGWAHIGGNMLFLWIFGDNVEDRLGHLRFVVFYLACGFAATYAQAFAQPELAVPTVGASGAIAGVLGAYLFLHPGARIHTLVFLGFLITTVEVPALVYLPVWFILQLLSGVAAVGAATSAQAGGVAWFAHIGGFVAGPLLLLALGGRRRPAARRPRALS